MRKGRAILVALLLLAGGALGFLGVRDRLSQLLPGDAPTTPSTFVPGESPLGRKIADFSLADFNGRSYHLKDFASKPVLVVAFLGTECPLAKLYAPRLVALAKQYQSDGVAFLGIDSNVQDSIAELRHFSQTHGLNFPLLKDRGSEVADRFGAVRTPEAFVLDQSRRVRYWGRIDDQYGFNAGVSYQRSASRTNDLAEAINDLLAGREVRQPTTTAPGCLIGRSRQADPESPVTWSKQIAPIFARHCRSCHQPGQIGPFPLLTYEDTRGWAEMIGEVVSERRMPPWHADPRYGKFANDTSLSDQERELVVEWVRHGAPEGKTETLGEMAAPIVQPPAETLASAAAQAQRPQFDRSRPDLTIPMSETFQVPAEGLIDYQYFFADPEWTSGKWIAAVRVVPGNRSVVHHITVYYRRRGESWNPRLDGKVTLLTGYLPGQETVGGPQGVPQDAPDASFSGASAAGAGPAGAGPAGDGSGRRVEETPTTEENDGLGAFVYLPPFTEFLFEMHYTTNGTPQEDRSYIEMWFADPSKVKRELFYVVAQNANFEIPPMVPDYLVGARYTFDEDALLSALTPHMHLRGKSFRIELIDLSGKREVLLDVPQFDFNWQTSYQLAVPRLIQRGTMVECVAHYDNSVDNLANPDPTVAVLPGYQTKDEMMTATFTLSRALTGDPANYIADIAASTDEEDDSPALEALGEETAAGSTAERQLAAHRVETAYERGKFWNGRKQWQRAIDNFTKVIDVAPKYRNALLQRGRARANLGALAEAEQDFLRSIELNPRSASRAQVYLGEIADRKGDKEDAIKHFESAIEADPTNAGAHLGLARRHLRDNRIDEAAEHAAKASQLQPNVVSTICLLADIRLLQKRLEDASRLYDEAMQLAPQQPEAYYGLGLVCIEQKRFESAVERFAKAIELSPGFAAAYAKRGAVYHFQKRYPEALADLEKAAKLSPDDPLAQFHLGVLYAEQHRDADALAAFRTVLRASPHHVAAANRAAWIAATSRKPEVRDGALAVELAKQACEATSYQSAAQLDTLAAAYGELGDFGQAIKACEQALALAKKSGNAELAQQIRVRLALFEKGQPYRE